jgi:predicted DNA-binding transcriptional regulator AlpA
MYVYHNVRKRTSRNTKNENKRHKIYLIRLESVFEKKTMVKSVIYLLFSYQTGYNVTFPSPAVQSRALVGAPEGGKAPLEASGF